MLGHVNEKVIVSILILFVVMLCWASFVLGIKFVVGGNQDLILQNYIGGTLELRKNDVKTIQTIIDEFGKDSNIGQIQSKEYLKRIESGVDKLTDEKKHMIATGKWR